jgi:hypothetical protein
LYPSTNNPGQIEYPSAKSKQESPPSDRVYIRLLCKWNTSSR